MVPKIYDSNFVAAKQEQISVRSHSPDIAEDINREIEMTSQRLAFQHSDITMTVESAAMSKHGGTPSHRSGSNDSSSQKRAMKSN